MPLITLIQNFLDALDTLEDAKNVGNVFYLEDAEKKELEAKTDLAIFCATPAIYFDLMDSLKIAFFNEVEQKQTLADLKATSEAAEALAEISALGLD